MKFKNFEVVLLCCLFILGFFKNSWSQINDRNISARKYEWINKEIVFNDQFENDQNKWLDVDSINQLSQPQNIEIKDGNLLYHNVNPDRILAYGISIIIDYQRDFEIEFLARIISAPKKQRAAGVLFWGRDSLKSASFLYFNKKGRFDLIDCTGGNWGKCKIQKAYANNFNAAMTQKITLRKIYDKYYLFVNEHFVETFPFSSLKGNLLGLGAGKNTAMQYDYITISYLF